MKQRTKHHLMGIGATVPFVIVGWWFVFAGNFKWFMISAGVYVVFIVLLSTFLSRGHKRSWFRDSPWAQYRIRVGQPVNTIRDLLTAMQEEEAKERKSFFGQRLTNRLYTVEHPGHEGIWRLNIETSNDNVTAYAVGFVSEVSPFLDCSRFASGRHTWFLRTEDSG